MIKPACILFAMVAAIGIGCRAKPVAVAAPLPRPRVIQPMAFVNGDQVIRAMGWDHEISQGMAIVDRQLNGQLNRTLLQLHREELDARTRVAKFANLNAADTIRLQTAKSLKDLYSLPITTDERQILLISGIQANLAMSDAQVEFWKEKAKRQAELIDSYRTFVMPAAQSVAAKSGFRMVLALDNTIVYHAPSTDISQKVIDQLNHDRPSWEQPAGK